MAEQLVACGMLSLVITLSVSVLQPCLVDWRILQDRSDMERSSSLAGQLMSRELRASTASSMTVLTTPPAVSFLAVSTTTSQEYDPLTGEPLWDHFVIYYVDVPNQILYRKFWPGNNRAAIPPLPYKLPSTTAAQLSAAELLLVCTTSNGSERPFARLVDGLDVQSDAVATVLQLHLSVETRRGKSQMVRRIAIQLRND